MSLQVSSLRKISEFMNYFFLKIKKCFQIYKFQNQVSFELLTNKYLVNYKNIVLPFKANLPLVKYGKNPILKEGKIGEWDEMGIMEPFILFDEKKFYLYYESCTNSKKIDWQIGVATADKITGPWIKNPNNPILRYTSEEGTYDKQCIADPCVIYHNGKYHMWFDMYDGKTWRIGKAYSSNGINWNKFEKGDKTAIVLDIGKTNQWDNYVIHCPEVYFWNNRFHLLYGGVGIGDSDYKTGLAIQEDENGEIFRKWFQVTNNEMLNKGLIISRMQAGFVLKGIIFAGIRVKNEKTSFETTYMFYSDDGGKSWNKITDNILESGNSDNWDSQLFYGPNCWIISKDKLWCAYLGGKSKNARRLGLAYMGLPKIK